MKTTKLAFFLTITFFYHACNTKPSVDNPKSSKLLAGVKYDTINKTDGLGFKQGLWTITDWDKTEELHKLFLIEKGNYVDNKKQGDWYYYDSTGKISRIVAFKDDFPVKK